jgi:hypothetical protein
MCATWCKIPPMTQEVTSGPIGTWIPSDASFGARLALVRQQMQWGNIAEAALACGVPTESWRSWERDNRLPRDLHQKAERIAGATGCDLMWLMTGRAVRLPRDPNGGLAAGRGPGTIPIVPGEDSRRSCTPAPLAIAA